MFDAPENLDSPSRDPAVGTAAGRPRSSAAAAAGAAADGRATEPSFGPYEAFVAALLTAADDRRCRRTATGFLIALRALFEYAARAVTSSAALTSNEALAVLVRAWNATRPRPARSARPTRSRPRWRIGHMLGPLAVAAASSADIVHSSMNGLSVLVGMAAKWRHGTPLIVSEHGIYLRERYMAFLEEDAPHAVKVLVLAFFRLLAEAAYLVSDALAPHSSYNRRWQLQRRRRPRSHVDDVQRRRTPRTSRSPTASRSARPSSSWAGSIRSRTCTR